MQFKIAFLSPDTSLYAYSAKHLSCLDATKKRESPLAFPHFFTFFIIIATLGIPDPLLW